jgi:hypothetical protein
MMQQFYQTGGIPTIQTEETGTATASSTFGQATKFRAISSRSLAMTAVLKSRIEALRY